jgi:hypothetical protein
MNEYNIIGDIAGQYDTLLALLDKMPKTATPFSVGDMNDRGPKNKEVLEFFMKNGKAVLGNHEHLMLTEYQSKMGASPYYESGVWLSNGGIATLQSFLPDVDVELLLDYRAYQSHFDPEDPIWNKAINYYWKCIDKLPADIMNWLAALPLYHEEDGLFISHGVKNPVFSLEKACDLNVSIYRIEDTLIWNRGSPRRYKNTVQIYGHNSYRDTHYHKDEKGVFAIGIDTSRVQVLTGIHWPSMQIYQQEYI